MRGLQSVEEHAESEPEVVRRILKASHSSSRPYPLVDFSQSENSQPGDFEALNRAMNPDGQSVLDIALVTMLTSIKATSMLSISLTNDAKEILCNFPLCYVIMLIMGLSVFSHMMGQKGKVRLKQSTFKCCAFY